MEKESKKSNSSKKMEDLNCMQESAIIIWLFSTNVEPGPYLLEAHSVQFHFQPVCPQKKSIFWFFRFVLMYLKKMQEK